jgi:DNA-binding NtrC family response regulator
MSGNNTISHILIADDERVIADTLALILNMNGFKAIAVYSGEEAVETAKLMNPDLLISDVVMKEMSGIEAAMIVREAVPGCRILLISGHASSDEGLNRTSLKEHAFELLSKPFHPQILIDRLHKVPWSSSMAMV